MSVWSVCCFYSNSVGMNELVYNESSLTTAPSSVPLKSSHKKGSANAATETQSKKRGLFFGRRHKMHSPELQPYPMNKKNHGLALLIVNEEFRCNPNHPNVKELCQRQGAGEDIEQLKEVWTYLGYRVRVEKNLTMEEIETVFDEVQGKGDSAMTIQESDDSFVCCVCSHGTWDQVLGTDVVYGTDGVRREDGQTVKGAMNIKVLALEKFSPHSCLKLKGRPKMFFVQACRGGKSEMTISVSDTEAGLPPEADFIFVFSTAPGRQSYRNDLYGSIFITDLSTSLKKHAHSHDLISILQGVIQRETEQDDPCELHGNKGDVVTTRQCPNFVSSLRRPVFFFTEPRQHYERHC